MTFDESKHPRGEKGSHEGGKFVASERAYAATQSAYDTVPGIHAGIAHESIRRGDLKQAHDSHITAAIAHRNSKSRATPRGNAAHERAAKAHEAAARAIRKHLGGQEIERSLRTSERKPGLKYKAGDK